MKLLIADTKEKLDKIEALYLKSFPKEELKPFSLLLEKSREGKGEMLYIEKNGEFAGHALMAVCDNMALLDYFAIDENKRGQGLGSEALELIKKRYEDKLFFLEAESLKVPCDNREQRERRIKFYRNCGMVENGTFVEVRGVAMEVFVPEKKISFEQYKELYRKVYGEEICSQVKLLKMDRLFEEIKKITETDTVSYNNAKKRWDEIAKPLGSLGKLESAVSQMAGIFRTDKFNIDKKILIVMCADNGVVEEGVTQTGQEVTAIVAENFLDEKSCAAIMCKNAGAHIRPIDIGMAVDTKRVEKRKISYGTKNLAKEPAMTRKQAEDAILTGIDIVREVKEDGYSIIATGEMGIGNTTTSSAICAVLLDKPVEAVTGRGAGLSTKGLNKKINVIKSAIDKHKPDKNDPVDVLTKVGGYDIAGLAGVFLGSAIYRIPVVIDGFISAVAALIAIRLCPKVADYILPSHVSAEPAGKMLLDALKKEPFLTCDMCLGEGTGAVALFPILDMAMDVYKQMGTFEDNDIESYVPLR